MLLLQSISETTRTSVGRKNVLPSSNFEALKISHEWPIFKVTDIWSFTRQFKSFTGSPLRPRSRLSQPFPKKPVELHPFGEDMYNLQRLPLYLRCMHVCGVSVCVQALSHFRASA